jgi:hypothetical protein
MQIHPCSTSFKLFKAWKFINKTTQNKNMGVVTWVTEDKGKAIPLQAWAGPEGSRKLRLLHFKTVGTWRW